MSQLAFARTGSMTMTTTNSCDAENRLITAAGPTNAVPRQKTTFVYDGLGRLREQLQWTNGSSSGPVPPPSSGWKLTGGTYYVYDGKRVIQERDTNNTPTVSYTRGNDLSGSMEGAGGIGGLLARSDGYSGGSFTTNNYYHADGNGNITYLVNSSQSLAASYRYDPFGNLLSSSGTLATANTYQFSSKEYVPSAGLYYYLYRFYDTSAQRWINRDPIGEAGGENLYMFVNNNPILYIDTVGNRPQPPDPDPFGAPIPRFTNEYFWFYNKNYDCGCMCRVSYRDHWLTHTAVESATFVAQVAQIRSQLANMCSTQFKKTFLKLCDKLAQLYASHY